ncbi:MBL fold metallo-hydrolase [Alkalibacter mobilis]|uniref:MBL fold metallo-hydrolase n=1 Tax=Alkalibacter mobilis TaxID=2787712 RepID=UPI00189C6268|nr:MBL fold metallo-hydrolase [Alkalibacter mobilis]MBF7095802.1 MBL fold metallo-hydrolase [Alkalibacter mobilis]
MNDKKFFKINILGWWGAFPQPGGATSGVLITTEEGRFLIDIGSGVLSKYVGLGNADDDLKGVLISHLHYDHMGDLGCLGYTVNFSTRTGLRKNKLKVYAPQTPDIMWNAIQYPYYETFALSDGMKISLAGTIITVKKLNHTIECYGFRIEKCGKVLVYHTDSSFEESHKDYMREADLLLCEATVSKNTKHSTGIGHMSDLEAGKIAELSGAKKLCLIHLPSDGNLELMRARAATEFTGSVSTPDICSEFIL